MLIDEGFMMKYFFYIMIFIFCSGCAVLSNTEGMMTLADYAKEHESINKEMQRRDALFDEFVLRIQKGESFQEKNRDWFVREFDQPILIKEEHIEGVKKEKWLYRYSAPSQGSFKIYLFFSQEGLCQEVLLIPLKK